MSSEVGLTVRRVFFWRWLFFSIRREDPNCECALFSYLKLDGMNSVSGA